LTAVLPIAMLVGAVRVHTTGFGAYRQLLPVIFLQVFTAQIIIIAGIAIAIITQHENIFTRNENVLPAADPGRIGAGATWTHASAHVGAMILLSLAFWVVGSLVLLAARKLELRHAQ